MGRIFLSLLLGMAFVSPASAQQYQDWYPTSVTPPAGHRYPCNLTALPRDLTGIPEADKRFINHVYSMLLKCVQAKLLMIDELMKESGSIANTYSKYYADTRASREKIMQEPVPAGLETFRNAVVNAIDTQMQFFAKAVKSRQSGQSAQQILNIPEGRTASSLLFNAWHAMQGRYPSMSAQVSDSTYHHLCALDLF